MKSKDNETMNDFLRLTIFIALILGLGYVLANRCPCDVEINNAIISHITGV